MNLPDGKALGRKPSRLIASGFIFFSLCALQLCLLKALPYSSSWLEHAELDLRKPSPNFRIGSLNWNVEAYSTDEALSPLRDYFAKTCPGLKGLEAALAITRDFEKRFPFGEPRLDFFAPNYDLLQDFRDHIELGAPGHCVTYSGLLTAVLLSAGYPARVVQVYSTSGRGHNVMEVWDEQKGWVMIDPSMKTLLQVDEKARPESDQNHELGSDATVIPVGKAKAKEKDLQARFYNDFEDGVLRGPRVYPEPWLYVRCGSKAVFWPFRGEFMVIGRRPWSFGPFQRMLLFGIVSTSILGAASVLVGTARFAFRSQSPTAAN